MNDFKKIREKMENKDKKILSENEIKTLKNFILLKEGLEDYDIVKLVLLKNNHDVEKDYIEKFKLFNYINENEEFTTQGDTFLESEIIIKKLKELIK
jgi:hypothetical protein